MCSRILAAAVAPRPPAAHESPARRRRRHLRPQAGPGRAQATSSTTLFERFFEELLKLNPLLATFIGDNRYNDRLPNTIGPEYVAQARALNQRYLDEIQAIDPDRLAGGGPHLLRHLPAASVLRALAVGALPGFELLPIDQAGGLLTLMPSLGSGTNAQPFATVQDYEHWLARLDGFAVWMDQAIVNMREGIAARRRAAAAGHGEGAAAARRDDRRRIRATASTSRRSRSFRRIVHRRRSRAADRRLYAAADRDGCCRPIAGCAISCATSTCRGRARASRGRRCRTARPGTHTSCRSTRRRR